MDGGGGPTRSAQGRRFHVLYRGAGPLVRTFDLGTVARALFAELEGKQLGSRTDGAFVHAALVRWEDVHVLVPSWLPPYLGQLGRKVERSGVTLPLAAWVAVEPDGSIGEREPTLDVPSDALEALPPASEPGKDVAMWPSTGVRVDAVLTHVEGMTGTSDGMRSAGLYRLAAATANAERTRGKALHAVGELVRGARTYEIGLSRPQVMLDGLLAVARHEMAHR